MCQVCGNSPALPSLEKRGGSGWPEDGLQEREQRPKALLSMHSIRNPLHPTTTPSPAKDPTASYHHTKHKGRLVRADLQGELGIDHFNRWAVILIWGSCVNKAPSALFSESVSLRPMRLVEVTDTSGSFCMFQKGWWLCF